jgi:hypothetical protein
MVIPGIKSPILRSCIGTSLGDVVVLNGLVLEALTPQKETHTTILIKITSKYT